MATPAKQVRQRFLLSTSIAHFHQTSIVLTLPTPQTPLEKAHAVRAAKKNKREEIKAKRLAALKKGRDKKKAAAAKA